MKRTVLIIALAFFSLSFKAAGLNEASSTDDSSSFISYLKSFLVDGAEEASPIDYSPIDYSKCGVEFRCVAQHIFLRGGFSVEDSFFEGLALVSRTEPLEEYKYTSRVTETPYFLGWRGDTRLIATHTEIRVRGGKKYAYIDPTGELRIRFRFSQARSFSEGLAAVAVREYYKRAERWHHTDTWGYIDKEGNWAIRRRFEDARSFSGGLAAVKRNGQWGFINTAGEEVVEAVFDKVESFSDGLAKVSLGDSQVAYINTLGQVVAEFFGEYHDYGHFSEGLATVRRNGQWGFINKEGEPVIDPQFEYVNFFTEGLAGVQDAETGLWGFIDREGEWAVDPQFEYVNFFTEGLAGVQDAETGLWGFIDREGGWAVDPQFEYVGMFSSEAVAPVLFEQKYGYINKYGKSVIDPKFEYVRHFSEGFAMVSYQESEWFFVQVAGINYVD